jgi:hypothetical protein
VALFGRKINLSEDPISLVKIMRAVVEQDISSKEAVKMYHNGLSKKNLKSDRSLQKDLEITDTILKL